MKVTYLHAIVVIACLSSSGLQAQHPRILYSASDLAAVRDRFNNQSSSFPFDNFQEAIQGYEEDTAPTIDPDPSGFDYNKARLAKFLAFRYAVDEAATIEFGHAAYNWLLAQSSPVNGTSYAGAAFDDCMVNGLALVDYCIAFDLLAGADYFRIEIGAIPPADTTTEHSYVNRTYHCTFGKALHFR